MFKLEVIRDHQGKISQGRVGAVAGTLTGCALCLATLWGHEPPSWELLGILLGVPGGWSAYQKANAPMEKPKKKEDD